MLGQRIRNYRILREIGKGGMGVVYEAIREDINIRAALKLLRPEFAANEELSARFVNEARASNVIEHPGIVKVFDFGREPDGTVFLVMELLDGETLAKRLRRLKRLSELETARLGRQIAASLAAAHAKQVIHRDLKPENIFIVADSDIPGGAKTKILDFGLAKLNASGDAGLTGQNLLMGTPIYMSPEQCRGGKNSSDRSDVYSLGTMLFELLAGRPPFIAEEPGEYIGLHLHEQPPPLASLVPGVSQAFYELIDSMLSKSPEARPTMVAVERMLREICGTHGDLHSPSSDQSSPSSDERNRAVFSSANPLAATDPALQLPAPPPVAAAATVPLHEAVPELEPPSVPNAGERVLAPAVEMNRRRTDKVKLVSNRPPRLRRLALPAMGLLLLAVSVSAFLWRRPSGKSIEVLEAETSQNTPLRAGAKPPNFTPPPLPDEVARTLRQAENLARTGAISEAMHELRRGIARNSHPVLWGTLGLLACRKHNVRIANESLSKLRSAAKDVEQLRSDLLLVCQSYDILENKDGKFVQLSASREKAKDTASGAGSEASGKEPSGKESSGKESSVKPANPDSPEDPAATEPDPIRMLPVR